MDEFDVIDNGDLFAHELILHDQNIRIFPNISSLTLYIFRE